MGKYLMMCCVVVLSFVSRTESAKFTTNFCYAGMSCFPSANDRSEFTFSLDGTVFFPFQGEYDEMVILNNVRETRFPAMIVAALSTTDVQRSVAFARKYNLRMTVLSSGHDYFGRCTGDGSLQISLRNISNIDVNLSSSRHPDGEIRIGSGAQWISVYEKLTGYNRVVVGGSAHSVAIGGYTLGGGHSPMSRMFGLAIDNLLEVEMVLANGSLAVVSEAGTDITNMDGSTSTTKDSSLFWALRGGGGGTFGIATQFTFKLHQAAPEVVRLSVAYPMILSNGTFIGGQVLEKMSEIILKTPRQWGGYFSTHGLPDPGDNTVGSISMFLNHYGPWESDSRKFIDDLYNYNTEWQKYRQYNRYQNFIGYEKTAIDSERYRTYISNILMTNESFTESFVQTMLKLAFAFPMNSSAVFSTGTWVGGKVHEVDEDAMAIHPGFRKAYLSLTTGISWDGRGDHDNEYIVEGEKVMEELRPFGYGSYRNEGSADSPSWKSDFWGSHYDRLLAIKRMVDPDNVFTCADCVGRDM